jgi:RNA polymerase sigma-70 factor (ECF subfamily)
MEEIPAHADWKQWFHAHGPKLLLCARQWTRSFADAEDVVQEAFVRFWKNQRGLVGDPIALLVTSVRRAAVDRARRDPRRVAREQHGSAEIYFEPSAEIENERQQAIEAALRRLPDEQREVLSLKIWGELTFEQIGRQLELSPNTVASRYRYALTSLRKELNSAQTHG